MLALVEVTDDLLAAVLTALLVLIRLEVAERRAHRERLQLQRDVRRRIPPGQPGGRRDYDPPETPWLDDPD